MKCYFDNRFVPFEKRQHTSDNQAKINADKLLKRSMRRDKFVRFFAMTKPVGNYHEAVVECTPPQILKDRMSHWMDEGYLKNKETNNVSGDIETSDKQEYELELEGNIKKKFGRVPTAKLQFHEKGESFKRIQIEIEEKDSDESGAVCVYEKSADVNDVPFTDEVTILPIFLYDSPISVGDSIEDSGFKGTLENQVTRHVNTLT